MLKILDTGEKRASQYAETSAEASRPEEVVHGWEAIRSGDAVGEKDCKAWIAGPQRVPPLAIFRRIAPVLLYGMHREAAGTIEPALVARAPEEFQKRVAITCRAVTEARSLAQRPGLPSEFASTVRRTSIPRSARPAKQFTMPGAP